MDPWRHPFGARYVADTGQLRQPDPDFPLVHYVDAYPPLFDVLLAQPVAILGVTSVAAKGVAALLVAVAPLALECTPWADGDLAMARRCSRGDLPDGATLATWLRDHGYRYVVIDPSVAELQRALGRGGATTDLGLALDADAVLRPRGPHRGETLSSGLAVWDVVPRARSFRGE